MPHIPEEIIDQIRTRADIVDLVSQITPVQKRGNDFWACCPFHHEKTPSFKISPERQNYYCFGCKKSGNVFTFVKETVNTDFVGAVRWLADRMGITIPEDDGKDAHASAQKRQWKDNCLRLLNDAAVWFHENLRQPFAEPARNYIRSRELDQDAVDHFMLGYSPDDWEALATWAKHQGYTQDQLLATGLVIQKENANSCYDRFRGRLTFPIWNELGQVVGFSARVLVQDEKTAKYVNSPESDFFQKGSILYAFNFARTAFKNAGRALVCEGQLDVIACHRAGLTHAIAAQGTAFTEQHAKMLKRSTQNVTLAFDADTAGQKATFRTVGLLHAQGIAVEVATLPDGDDPDGIFRRGGPEALNAIMASTRPAVHYLFNSLLATHDISRAEDRADVAKSLLEIIRPIPDPIAKAGHCQWLAQQLNIPEHFIFDELKLVDASQKNRLANQLAFAMAPQRKQTMDKQALPAFAMPEPNENTLQCLLELILKFEPVALALEQNEDLQRLIPDSPLGKAIFDVLAHVENGEWTEAENDIAASELAENPAIGKALAQNDFSTLLYAGDDSKDAIATKNEKIDIAFNECVAKLMIPDLDRQIAELNQQILNAPDDQQPQLQTRLFALVSQKNSLKPRWKK